MLLFFCVYSVYAQDTLHVRQHGDTIYYKTAKHLKKPKPLTKKIRPEAVELKRNVISLNVLDIFLKNITFSTEFIPGNGKTSIVMPITFYSPLGKAFANSNNSDMGKYHQSLATYIRAGFDLNYYFNGQRRYSPLTGVSLQGSYMRRDVDVQVDENKGVYQGLYFYFLGKVGITRTLGNHFLISLIIHAGAKTPDLQQYYFALLGGVNFGVRF